MQQLFYKNQEPLKLSILKIAISKMLPLRKQVPFWKSLA